MAGALADSLEGVAAEACAAGARVGVWTCAAGISPRSGGRGPVIRAAAPGQGREAGSLAEDKNLDWAKPAGQTRSGKTTIATCHAKWLLGGSY